MPRVWAASLKLGLGLVACAQSLMAHDVWLEPTSFNPGPGETVGIDVWVGEPFEGEAIPRRPWRIADFWFGNGPSRRPVRGVDGMSPAGVVRLGDAERGWRVARYVSRPAAIELSASRFETHLVNEGLTRILAIERALAPRGRVIREVYSRCVATLLAVGGQAGTLPEAPGGCELSLWPVGRLPRPGTDELLDLGLCKNGRPVEGAVVSAWRKGGSRAAVGRTDVGGRVRLALPEAGIWLLKVVHMEPVSGGESDWRSWWASLTFELLDR